MGPTGRRSNAAGRGRGRSQPHPAQHADGGQDTQPGVQGTGHVQQRAYTAAHVAAAVRVQACVRGWLCRRSQELWWQQCVKGMRGRRTLARAWRSHQQHMRATWGLHEEVLGAVRSEAEVAQCAASQLEAERAEFEAAWQKWLDAQCAVAMAQPLPKVGAGQWGRRLCCAPCTSLRGVAAGEALPWPGASATAVKAWLRLALAGLDPLHTAPDRRAVLLGHQDRCARQSGSGPTSGCGTYACHGIEAVLPSPLTPSHVHAPATHAGAMHAQHPSILPLQPFAAQQRARAEAVLLQQEAGLARRVEALHQHSMQVQRALLARIADGL